MRERHRRLQQQLLSQEEPAECTRWAQLKAALSLASILGSTMQGPVLLLVGRQVLESKRSGPLACEYAFFGLLGWLEQHVDPCNGVHLSLALALHPCSAGRQGHGVSSAPSVENTQQAASRHLWPIKRYGVGRCR